MESKLRSSAHFFFSSTNLFLQYLRGYVSGVKLCSDVLVLLRGRLDTVEEEGVASAALEGEPAVPMKGGIAGLKVVLFLPLLPWPDMMNVMWLTTFSVKEGVKPEKRGFEQMRKKLGEKFGVVFSLTVVVTDTELLSFFFFFFYIIHTACKPKAYDIDRHARQRKTQPLSSCTHQGHPTSPPKYIRQARLMPNIPQAVTECHQRFRGQCPSRRVSKPINPSSANHLHLIILSILFTGTFSDRALSAGG